MKQKLIIIGVLIIALLLLGFFVQRHSRNVQLGVRIDGPSGVVPNGLPQGLVPNSATVKESYQIPYESSTQTTVDLETTDTVRTAYDFYLKKFQHDYTMVDQTFNIKTDQAHIYAKSKDGSEDYNIVVYKNNISTKTQIVLSYLNKETK